MVAWLVAGTLARPLQNLAGTARRIADGDLAARAPIEGAEEQRAVAGAFNMMTDRLVRSLEAQRDFVANASHQLRTPLTGLKLRLEAAGIQTDDPAVQRELAAAEREADRLARLVTDLLALAARRRTRGGARTGRPPRRSARCRGALLAPRGRHVAVDRAGRGAAGLCVGVVRRRRDGARQPDRERAHPHAAGDADRARGGDERQPAWVAVLDDGPGLAPEDLALAFERFRRGARRKPDAPGSGLGLAIAGTLAERWGGRALITNRKGGGARAELRLPRDFAVR